MPNGVLLAAGRGIRLGALTQHVPKPLLPVANQPVMLQGISSLRSAGVSDVYVNLWYRAEQVVATLEARSDLGIRIKWSHEPQLMGTAGAIKAMERFLRDDLIVVVSGDAALDVDLTPLLTAHREHGAFATLGMIEVSQPSRYGVVLTDQHGRIQRFQEKPVAGSEISRWANTGIYVFDPGILDLIPAQTCCDFALDVFPKVIEARLPFYAWPVAGHWRDIGSPHEYLAANIDYLQGRVQISSVRKPIAGNCIAEGADVHDAILTRCVVGKGALIPDDCHLTNTVVWPDTHVPAGLDVCDGILTPWGLYQLCDGEIRSVWF